MAYADLMDEIVKDLRILRKFSYVVTSERHRVLNELNNILPKSAVLLVLMPDGKWMANHKAFGAKGFEVISPPSWSTMGAEYDRKPVAQTPAFVASLREMLGRDFRGDVSVCAIPTASVLDDPAVRQVLWELKAQMDADIQCLTRFIFINPLDQVPDEFRGIFNVIHDTGFTLETAAAFLAQMGKTLYCEVGEGAAEAAVGMTEFHVSEAIASAVIAQKNTPRTERIILADHINLWKVKIASARNKKADTSEPNPTIN